MLYQLAFQDAEIIVCPVDCYGITQDNWHSFEYGIDRVLGELARCGNQFVGEIKEFLKILKHLDLWLPVNHSPPAISPESLDTFVNQYRSYEWWENIK